MISIVMKFDILYYLSGNIKTSHHAEAALQTNGKIKINYVKGGIQTQVLYNINSHILPPYY
jgi:hypothetical protein